MSCSGQKYANSPFSLPEWSLIATAAWAVLKAEVTTLAKLLFLQCVWLETFSIWTLPRLKINYIVNDKVELTLCFPTCFSQRKISFYLPNSNISSISNFLVLQTMKSASDERKTQELNRSLERLSESEANETLIKRCINCIKFSSPCKFLEYSGQEFCFGLVWFLFFLLIISKL